MSCVLEVVVPEVPSRASALVERVRTFAGQPVVSDPRVFVANDRLALELRATPDWLLSRVRAVQPEASISLVLDEVVVSEWAADKIAVADREAFSGMLSALSTEFSFTVALESASGAGEFAGECRVQDVATRLDEAFKDRIGLCVLYVASE